MHFRYAGHVGSQSCSNLGIGWIAIYTVQFYYAYLAGFNSCSPGDSHVYGTPNETKFSKRKRQQIVSESSFNEAVDYDFGLF